MSYWDEQCKLLQERMKKSDVSNFLQWDFVKHNMFHESHSLVLDALRDSKYWEEWKNKLKEDKFGNPNPYYLLPESSGNLLWHAYSLLQLMNNTSYNVSSSKSVFEFGGGYGSFCRMMFRLGFNGEYTLYDLPVWLDLQSIFLRNVGLSNKLIAMFSSMPVGLQFDIDLFISLWAISESPMEVRKRVFEKIEAKHYLIAFQKKFENVDNIEYFDQFKKDRPNYKWVSFEIAHIPENYYLMGERED